MVMTYPEEVICPDCGESIMASVVETRFATLYSVDEDCKKCGLKAGKIEDSLNGKGEKTKRFSLEKPWLKVNRKGD